MTRRPPLVLATVICLASLAPAAEKGPPARRIVGYFVEWGVYARKYHVANIPAARLTHLNYAFAKIANGRCALFDRYAAVDKAYPGDTWKPGVGRGSFNQLRKLKAKHPHLKTLISVGGWTLSGPFSDVALTPAARTVFAKSCVEFMVKYGFDGVDIDWEYPVSGGKAGNRVRPADKTNYTLLLAELRKQLDARGKADRTHYLLTIAAPAGPDKFRNIELAAAARHLDWINLMSYDFHGSWSTLTNFNSALHASTGDRAADPTVRKHYNADSAVRAYLAAGVPASKIVLGAAFYGRGWAGVKNVNNGLYQPHAARAPKGTWEPGVFDYKDLAARYIGKGGFERHWHAEAKVPWLFDAKRGIMISYDDPESLRAKARYVNSLRLGGMMFWELSADTPDSALLTAIHSVLRPRK